MLRPDRSLLNSNFEGYKIDPVDEEKLVSRYLLQHRPSQTSISGRSPLSLKEVQSRIWHNHLALNPAGQALYIDEDLKVVLVELDLGTLEPTLRVVYELPRPVHSAHTPPSQREYPSAGHIDDRRWLVADGQGSMYVLDVVPQGGPSHVLATLDLSTLQTTPTRSSSQPFRVHDVLRISPDTSVAILSSKSPSEQLSSPDTPGNGAVNSAPSVSFDVWAVRFPITDEPAAASFMWHRKGDDVPICAYYECSRSAFLIATPSPLRPLISPPPARTAERSADELAPIPRAGENLDLDMVKPPPPYSWTQTGDAVTIAFPLPSTTDKSQIRVLFAPQTITLHVAGLENNSLLFTVPRYGAKKLWGPISPSSSLWTWDREGEKSFGLLTLHLDKKDEGTKWPQVFSPTTTPSSGSGSADPADVEVPETLDPSELANIRETLEKYTSSLRDGSDSSGLGLGSGVPGLATGEYDDDVDLAVGKEFCLNWIAMDGSTPSWGQSSADYIFTGLSTPLPGTVGDRITVVTKSNLDGVVFTLPHLTDHDNAQRLHLWRHTSTYSALSFVLASKQDTRFVHHIDDKAVFAFESGTRFGSGNVYVYRGAGKTDKWAKQAILRVSGSTAGSLLGVGAVRLPDARTVVVCLCESELVVIRDFV